tara:strand:+ start:19 stop:729 length:711 start_codon:yes stop_codon:yes gene_type:complete
MSEATDNVEAQAEAPEATLETTERPEWLPEKFNSPEDLVNSYSSLESKLGKSDEEIRNTLIEELEASANEGVPENAGAYTIPEEYTEDGDDLNYEFLEKYGDFAFKNGFNQEEFNDNLKAIIEMVPTPDQEEEVKKLGENANARIEAVGLWAQKFFPESLSPEIMRIGQTGDGVILLETVMNALNETPITGEAITPTRLSKEDLNTMMKDPRYWNPTQRDPGFIKEVDEGFQKLFK